MSQDFSRSLDAARSILETCDALMVFSAAGYDAYSTDLRTQWAVEMGFIRLGEAVSRLHPEIHDRFPGLPWADIIAMRNFTAHQYEDLSPRRVWRTLTHDVPAMREYVRDTVLPALEHDRESAADQEGAGS
ncbi:DUF86 domain-containing protein [Citricoccus nitrophenolicus]|uniref:HepT-like ribonuclease domain-containing protein n=1 Tax=Citricoccus nitrophenolicus TaxID=863575 RepID=UPI0031E5D2DE